MAMMGRWRRPRCPCSLALMQGTPDWKCKARAWNSDDIFHASSIIASPVQTRTWVLAVLVLSTVLVLLHRSRYSKGLHNGPSWVIQEMQAQSPTNGMRRAKKKKTLKNSTPHHAPSPSLGSAPLLSPHLTSPYHSMTHTHTHTQYCVHMCRQQPAAHQPCPHSPTSPGRRSRSPSLLPFTPL